MPRGLPTPAWPCVVGLDKKEYEKVVSSSHSLNYSSAKVAWNPFSRAARDLEDYRKTTDVKHGRANKMKNRIGHEINEVKKYVNNHAMFT